jgi:hypothetical protein
MFAGWLVQLTQTIYVFSLLHNPIRSLHLQTLYSKCLDIIEFLKFNFSLRISVNIWLVISCNRGYRNFHHLRGFFLTGTQILHHSDGWTATCLISSCATFHRCLSGCTSLLSIWTIIRCFYFQFPTYMSSDNQIFDFYVVLPKRFLSTHSMVWTVLCPVCFVASKERIATCIDSVGVGLS